MAKRIWRSVRPGRRCSGGSRGGGRGGGRCSGRCSSWAESGRAAWWWEAGCELTMVLSLPLAVAHHSNIFFSIFSTDLRSSSVTALSIESMTCLHTAHRESHMCCVRCELAHVRCELAASAMRVATRVESASALQGPCVSGRASHWLGNLTGCRAEPSMCWPSQLSVRAGGSLTNAKAAEGSAHPRSRAHPPSRHRGRPPPEPRAH